MVARAFAGTAGALGTAWGVNYASKQYPPTEKFSFPIKNLQYNEKVEITKEDGSKEVGYFQGYKGSVLGPLEASRVPEQGSYVSPSYDLAASYATGKLDRLIAKEKFGKDKVQPHLAMFYTKEPVKDLHSRPASDGPGVPNLGDLLHRDSGLKAISEKITPEKDPTMSGHRSRMFKDIFGRTSDFLSSKSKDE